MLVWLFATLFCFSDARRANFAAVHRSTLHRPLLPRFQDGSNTKEVIGTHLQIERDFAARYKPSRIIAKNASFPRSGVPLEWLEDNIIEEGSDWQPEHLKKIAERLVLAEQNFYPYTVGAKTKINALLWRLVNEAPHSAVTMRLLSEMKEGTDKLQELDETRWTIPWFQRFRSNEKDLYFDMRRLVREGELVVDVLVEQNPETLVQIENQLLQSCAFQDKAMRDLFRRFAHEAREHNQVAQKLLVEAAALTSEIDAVQHVSKLKWHRPRLRNPRRKMRGLCEQIEAFVMVADILQEVDGSLPVGRAAPYLFRMKDTNHGQGEGKKILVRPSRNIPNANKKQSRLDSSALTWKRVNISKDVTKKREFEGRVITLGHARPRKRSSQEVSQKRKTNIAEDSFSPKENLIPARKRRSGYRHARVIIFRTDEDHKLSVLLQRRAWNKSCGGCLGFVGGKPERSDRTSLDTAIREVFEETGLLDVGCIDDAPKWLHRLAVSSDASPPMLFFKFAQDHGDWWILVLRGSGKFIPAQTAFECADVRPILKHLPEAKLANSYGHLWWPVGSTHSIAENVATMGDLGARIGAAVRALRVYIRKLNTS